MKFEIFGILGLAILLVIFGRSVAFAQTPEEIAKKHGIIFPIAELGGCVDYSSCRTYCEDPVNQSLCIDFAKKKGFHKEESIQTKNRFIESAKIELGCDSEDSCREFCSKEGNWEKCGEFARRHRLSGGHTKDPREEEILEKAKAELGCSNYEACMSFCHEETNRQKCSDFANKSGLRGGESHVGPGGCNSEETCKAFCSDPNNFQECSKFGGGPGGGSGSEFHGPGGCNSEESCRAYCEKNPQDCKIIMGGEHGGVADPQNEKFCTANPEKCGDEEMGVSPGADPHIVPNVDLATECVKYGCSWNGNSCSCPGTSGTSDTSGSGSSTGSTSGRNEESSSYEAPSYVMPSYVPPQ